MNYITLGSNKLSYSIWSGNFSTPLIVSTVFHISTHNATVVITAMLLTTLLIVMMMGGLIRKLMAGIVSDPYIIASLAISITLALSPLSWFHYYSIILFPALWMITMRPGVFFCRIMGVLSLLLSSGMLSKMMGSDFYSIYLVTSSWIPVWLGTLFLIYNIDEKGEQIRF